MLDLTRKLLTGVAMAVIVASPPTALAVSPSPEPVASADPPGTPMAAVRDDILPGIKLEVEEVAPGAYRVLGDEVRDLTKRPARWVASGRDGSVWLGKEGAFRIGEPGFIRRSIYRGKLRVAPDGTVWTIERLPRTGKRVLSSFDGEAWQRHELPKPLRRGYGPIDLDVGADGTVWVVGGNRVAYSGESGWRLLPGKVPTQGFVVSDSGQPWSPFYLRRYEEGTWKALGGFDEQGYVGHDGTAWAQGWRNGDGTIRYVDRLDEGGRTSCPVEGQPYGFVPLIDDVSVAADGSLWGLYEMAPRVVGLARFDCTSWQYPLPGVEVGPGAQVAFADDGSVWVLAAPLARDEDGRETAPPHRMGTQRELYVITPEAVTGGER